jgi:hypothetical protein
MLCLLVCSIPGDGQSRKHPLILSVVYHHQNPLELTCQILLLFKLFIKFVSAVVAQIMSLNDPCCSDMLAYNALLEAVN